MTENTHPLSDELVSCEVYLKEMPLFEARNEEASDYVVYFCGLDCCDA